jgi:hypothetical protein
LPRLNWARPLPRPIIIDGIAELKTVGEVRDFVARLPAPFADRSTWRHVAACAKAAANGAGAVHVAVPLMLVLSLERVAWRRG